MNLSFKNKTVWIIGASSGIGKALAIHLNQLEAKIILSSRREDELLAIQKSASYPENIHILPLDLFDFSSFQKKTAQAFSFYNTIDFVFLNGGTSSRGSVSQTLLDVQINLMNLNYFSYVGLTKEILPFFEKQHSGHFIITSSVMGKISTPNRSAYAASKHALHGFFDCLRAEVFENNIAVTLLTPGHISTDISLHTLTADGTPKMERNPIHEKGLSAEKAAKQIIKAVIRKKKEVYIGKKISQDYISLIVFRFFPNLFHRIIRNFRPK